MRYLLALVSALSVGCSDSTGSSNIVDPPLQPSAPLPTTTGQWVGSYRVPTTPELAAAATYPVDHVEWTVANGIATLHYDLPVGLVGGALDVTLSGPITPGDTQIAISGTVGTGTCVATQTTVTCREEFENLGALPISTTVIEQQAAFEYAGPLSDRVELAQQFASDPIGIVDIDLRAPVFEDSPSDDD